MMLDVRRLRDSDLCSLPDPEARWCNVLAWAVSWHQLPAASLPDDDGVLARLMGFGRDVKGWKATREAGGLRGWVRCDDGRLYHPVVAEKALEAWEKQRKQRGRTRAASDARWARRETSGDDDLRNGDRDGLRDGVRNGDQEKGREEKGRDSTPSSGSKDPTEGASPPDGGNTPAAGAKGGKANKIPKPPPVTEKTLFDMAAVWNEIAVPAGLPSVSELTPRRRQQLKARIGDRWTTDPVRQFRAYIRRIAGSQFLTGGGSRGWRADFDWALQPRNVVQVAEGKYSDEEAG